MFPSQKLSKINISDFGPRNEILSALGVVFMKGGARFQVGQDNKRDQKTTVIYMKPRKFSSPPGQGGSQHSRDNIFQINTSFRDENVPP